MNFLEAIWKRLEECADRPVVQEARPEEFDRVTGGELLALIQSAREFLRRAGVKPGDRVALLAPNGIRWTAADLAIIAEGAIALPLYPRQAATELAVILKDADPVLLIAADQALATPISPDAGRARVVLYDEIFATPAPGAQASEGTTIEPPRPLAASDPVTLIYTSGTSGVPKGVPLTVANVDHMLSCTNGRLDELMRAGKHKGVDARTGAEGEETENVFQYLPCCFAGSWILLLTALGRDAAAARTAGRLRGRRDARRRGSPLLRRARRRRRALRAGRCQPRPDG